MSELLVGASDSAREGKVMPEVTHIHLYHCPGSEKEVNGFTLVVRIGDRSFTVAAREGVDGAGVEPVPAVAFDTGSADYLGLIEERHDSLAEVQNAFLSVVPQVLQLFDDIKA